jgi:hypothetical protein
MTIEDPKVIDIVATKPDEDVVRLVITDHLDWENPEEHLTTLQDKLNAYLDFVETGDLVTQFPDVSEKRVLIEVFFLHEPLDTAVHFLRKAESILQEFNVALTWRVRPTE